MYSYSTLGYAWIPCHNRFVSWFFNMAPSRRTALEITDALQELHPWAHKGFHLEAFEMAKVLKKRDEYHWKTNAIGYTRAQVFLFRHLWPKMPTADLGRIYIYWLACYVAVRSNSIPSEGLLASLADWANPFFENGFSFRALSQILRLHGC